MPKTRSEYIATLDDDREVYYRGEQIHDVTSHPVLSRSVAHAASEYAIQHEDPDTFLAASGHSRYFAPPDTGKELDSRRELIQQSTRQSDGVFNCIRAIGSDALFGLLANTPDIDHKHDTTYTARVTSYLDEVREADAGVVVAMTDAKGDRNQRPSEQPDPDTYIHVTEQTDDGVIIRGIKTHTSHAPVSNEIIVLPSRNIQETEAEFAIACAVPTDAPGVKLVCRPSWENPHREENPITNTRDELETITIFDDVFVPSERIFLNGETEFTTDIVSSFATFHRFTALAYKPELIDLFVGVAELLADSHGLARNDRIHQLIIDMIEYIGIVRGLSSAAAHNPIERNQLTIPNPLYCDVGKHYFAENYHQMVQHVQDIAGGFTATLPSYADFEHDDHGEHVKTALTGTGSWTARDRYKLFALAKDLTVGTFGGWQEVLSLHGEGSLATQELGMYTNYDREAARMRVINQLDLDNPTN